MIASCAACPGFVPQGVAACPHCGATVADSSVMPVKGRAAGAAVGAAKAAAAGAVLMTLMACYGDSSYDDGWYGCTTDADCGAGSQCDEFGSCVQLEICGNGADDDFDGFVDSNDEDCGITFELNCADGIDEDQDGETDCADLDCEGALACYENCEDDLDNDLDGLVDCLDLDCGVCGTSELVCDDGQDDEQDGLVDCDDPDCAEACAPPVCGDLELEAPEECDDGNVVDGDGCSATCTHETAFHCASLTPLMSGQNSGTTEGGVDLFAASCVGLGGPEARYSFTAQAAGTLYLTLDPQLDLGLYVLDQCSDEAFEVACINTTALDSLAVPLTEQQSIVVVVDGAPIAGPFDLLATFVAD